MGKVDKRKHQKYRTRVKAAWSVIKRLSRLPPKEKRGSSWARSYPFSHTAVNYTNRS